MAGRSIAIIGAGLSGTLTAMYLLRAAREATTVYLVEQDPDKMCRGVAYSSHLPYQPLNVQAHAMSVYLDDPHDFVQWLQQNQPLYSTYLPEPITPQDYIPRYVFGAYVKQRLHEAQTAAAPFVRLCTIQAAALQVRTSVAEPGKFVVALADGDELLVPKVVLALGNLPPTHVPIPNTAFYSSSRYVGLPWRESAIAGLPADAPVLLIGSSLTMVDLVGSLHAQGHTGIIYVVSRHGKLPQVHEISAPNYPGIQLPHPLPNTALALLQYARKEVARAEQDGYTWRSALGALRDAIPDFWQALPLWEQKCFLRHVRTFWETHRHRMPPRSHDMITELQEKGQLIMLAGTVADIHEIVAAAQVIIKKRKQQQTETLEVTRVINCTGPLGDFNRSDNPLIQNLLAQGLIQSDALRLGLRTTPDGTLIGADGAPVNNLYTLGPPRKGMLYESTAMREIRRQAAALADQLLNGQPKLVSGW